MITNQTVPVIIELVAKANPGRQKNNLNRRIHKLLEEVGEVSEAWLNATSATNHKKKEWADVEEEAADVLIVAADVALTPIDDDTQAVLQDRITTYVNQWLHHIDIGNVGYDLLVWRIVSTAARFGENYKNQPESAHPYSADMVRYAFALVNVVFKGDDAKMIAEVSRKLRKWAANRAENVVVTDAE